MAVEINIPPVLQALVNGVHQIDVVGATLGECLKDLVSKYPMITPKIFDKHGNLLKGVSIFMNGKNVYPKLLTTPVSDGAKIHISHIVLGG